MAYRFFGWDGPDAVPSASEYSSIRNQRDMYDILSTCWCAETCAPRLRSDWSPDNKTLGQCSITAFLVQDVFGGEVYGIPLPGGGYHCYNAVGDVLFDLTSEQFGSKVLKYPKENLQSRETHFSDPEKKSRYELLKENFVQAAKGE